MNEDGSFRKVNVNGKEYAGKELYDVLEKYARKGYYSINEVASVSLAWRVSAVP